MQQRQQISTTPDAATIGTLAHQVRDHVVLHRAAHNAPRILA
jgi:hypothetical protein